MINKSSIINGTKHFSLGIFQNYLVFMPALKYIKYFHATTGIYSWKSDGMSEESIENVTKSDSNFAPTFVDHHSLININFNGQYLIKNNICIHRKVINLYISYILGLHLRNTKTDFTLNNCLFGSVKLTKNTDPDKSKDNGYGIEFDSHSECSFTDGKIGRNTIIVGVNMSLSVDVDNKGKDILFLVEGQTQGLNHSLTAEANITLISNNQEKGLY